MAAASVSTRVGHTVIGKAADVRGKVIVVLVNDADFEQPELNTFNGRAMTYYGRWTYKYEEAARQGSPEAKFAMSSYFALGVAGVADQDKAQAVAFRIDSALAGFGPSAARLQAVLAQVSRSQQRR